MWMNTTWLQFVNCDLVIAILLSAALNNYSFFVQLQLHSSPMDQSISVILILLKLLLASLYGYVLNIRAFCALSVL